MEKEGKGRSEKKSEQEIKKEEGGGKGNNEFKIGPNKTKR